MEIDKSKMDKNKIDSFHESRDSSMDKTLPKKTVWQKYKYYILSGVAFAIFLCMCLLQFREEPNLELTAKDCCCRCFRNPFLDYVDAGPYTTHINNKTKCDGIGNGYANSCG